MLRRILNLIELSKYNVRDGKEPELIKTTRNKKRKAIIIKDNPLDQFPYDYTS